jgi:hypothetical protein
MRLKKIKYYEVMIPLTLPISFYNTQNDSFSKNNSKAKKRKERKMVIKKKSAKHNTCTGRGPSTGHFLNIVPYRFHTFQLRDLKI